MRDRLLRLLHLDDATSAEKGATLWTAAFFCALLCSYYMLRPLREEIGTAFGDENLLQLFTLTFVMVTVLNQPYMVLANRLPARRYLPLSLHGFALSFLVYGVLFGLAPPLQRGVLAWDRPECLLGATFYSWVTSFVVCGVALVWVHAVDHFTPAQGKRLFGLVSVGGTVGAILGSACSWAAAGLPRGVVMVAAAAAIQVSLWCYRRSRLHCERMVAERDPAEDGAVRVASAGVLQGLALMLRSPYLLGIAAFVVASSVAATVFYYQLNSLADAQLESDADRRGLFAAINLFHNALALWIQLAWTGPVLVRLGLGAALCAMPAVTLLGLSALVVLPLVGVMAVIEVVRRTLQFAFDKPAREVLFTPLGLEEKYKSKAVIDTAVLRLGDLLGAVLSDWLVRARIADAYVAAYAVPAVAVWAGLGLWLGRRCRSQQPAQARSSA